MNLNFKKRLLLFVCVTCLSIQSIEACSCYCKNDCSFSATSVRRDFVALVKVISHDNYSYKLGKKRVNLITVEIIKKYKGQEKRKTIKLWGGNGASCRSIVSNFKIGEHYLIAPYFSEERQNDQITYLDYHFFECDTDYLKVDMRQKKVYGKYSSEKNEATLTEFESYLLKETISKKIQRIALFIALILAGLIVLVLGFKKIRK
ncbi:hypothetical protein BKI52_15630 [marine bacterium AO1-C]|nr:hypothetical protein BKI52_15630 [marine bacterium AO1-C]